MCFSFCIFFLVSVHVGITSSAVELKLYALTARIRNSQSSRKEKKYNSMVLTAKTKFYTIDLVIDN